MNDTIVAIATPPGRGGVGIVRLSGQQAYAIALTINGQQKLTPRFAKFCSFYHLNELIDQGLILYFPAPNSFTGEEIIEFHAHGSPVVLDVIITACLAQGARLARPGEFSQRAFLHDKIDLTQAEAISDLINASSQTAARLALNSLQGLFSTKINELNQKVIHLRLHVEAAIDFPDEEIDFLHDGPIKTLLHVIISELESIQSQAKQGALLREGLSMVLVGRPNAGKSTLINQLAGRDVAIVTEIAGTTRDVMREQILIDDIPLHIIDTAGLRDSADIVEQEGIKRAWKAIDEADFVLLLTAVDEISSANALYNDVRATFAHDKPIIEVINKIDCSTSTTSDKPNDRISISAKYGIGIDTLKQAIKQLAGFIPHEGTFLARRRHLNALTNAHQLLITGQQQLAEHQALELLAEDLRVAHHCLGEITGEFSSDDLLGHIFSNFCIGK